MWKEPYSKILFGKEKESDRILRGEGRCSGILMLNSGKQKGTQISDLICRGNQASDKHASEKASSYTGKGTQLTGEM